MISEYSEKVLKEKGLTRPSTLTLPSITLILINIRLHLTAFRSLHLLTVTNYIFETMVRPTIDLEPFQNEVTDLFINQNHTWSQIAEHLHEQGIAISTERLRKRALREWGLKKRSDPGNSTQIIGRVRELFLKFNLND